jgi:hypothetical protein
VPAGVPTGAAPLRRGVNLTNWFRFPPADTPAALEAYLPEAAIAALRHAGFDFVRLAVQPAFVRDDRIALVLGAVARLQRQGFAVIAGPHPADGVDAGVVLDFWQRLAPALRRLPPRLTVPEIANEPVFAHDAAGWAAVQDTLLAAIRRSLPGRRVVLTGNDWGGIDGLLALRPVADADVIYSFHFYEPPEITALAPWRPGLDRAALARLPFPASEAGCAAAAVTPDAPTRDVVRYVCAMHWDTARVAARIAAAASWGARHGVPVLMGEFGASAALNAPARLAWIEAARRAAETGGIGWALWGYDDAMGFGARPPGAAPLDAGVLAALGMR